MKKILALLLLASFANNLFAQKNIIGTWEGKLMGQLRIVFHFEKKDGTITGTFDSPDQHAIGLPLSSVTIVGDSVFATISAPKAAFNVFITNDSTLTGNWLQGGAKYPLLVTKKNNNGGATVQNRPQTPKPPFPYILDSVEYNNADKTVHLGATFTRPTTNKKYPVVVLITGSGQQDRDETIFGHHSFAVIADYLTKNGFAVLRVDDRQMGKSTGNLTNATSLDFANDVITSLNYLKTRPDVDTTKMGLIGHSEGGFIAPIIYSKWQKVAFIISLAGTGISGEEILLPQLTNPLKQTLPSASFNAFYTLTKQQLKLIHDNTTASNDVLLQKTKQVFNQWKKNQPDSISKQLNMADLTADTYATQNAFEQSTWMRYFIATDPSQFWQQVKCPVLALNGSKDIQVFPNQNIPAIAAALKKAGNKNITTQIIPGLNHLFQRCNTCTGAEYAELEETFAPEALEIMGDWLRKRVIN